MILSIALFVCALFASSEGAGWQLVWQDDFNGNSLNEGEWNYETGGNGWGNNEMQFYTARRRENARVQNGYLIINVKVEKHQGKEFTSARLTSKKAWTYGKFEAKAKLPKGKNLWPAIWMMPHKNTYGGWAASGEIDIMEYRGERPTFVEGTIHYGGAWPNNIYTGSSPKNFNKDFSTGDHIFGVEWDKNEMRWYVDGQQYFKQNINRNMWSKKGNNPYNHNGAPFDHSFHWILNIAVGGNFFPQNQFGKPVTPAEAKKWPKPTMEIDWLKVYQWK